VPLDREVVVVGDPVEKRVGGRDAARWGTHYKRLASQIRPNHVRLPGQRMIDRKRDDQGLVPQFLCFQQASRDIENGDGQVDFVIPQTRQEV